MTTSFHYSCEQAKKTMQFLFVKKSCSTNILLLNLIFSLLFSHTNAVIKLPPNETIPAVLIFGDSNVDTGNNNNLITIGKCNYRPYGNDFKGQVSTGRYSNGKVLSDMIVESLGIKELMPAYLDPHLRPQDLPTGVSFASGGSGYDPLTSTLASCLSLSDQLELFQKYIVRLQGIVGANRTNFILAKSLFALVLGTCDIANTYFGPTSRRIQYDLASYANLMVNYASEFLEEIYGLGARRIVVFGAPPIGCVPSQKTLAGGIFRECAEDHNQAAKLFNAKLIAKLDSLNINLPNSRMVYVDIYNPILDLIANPQNYGFKFADKGCCGTGIIEVGPTCNPLSAICANVSDYVFWDSFHPTERAYKVILSIVIPKLISDLF